MKSLQILIALFLFAVCSVQAQPSHRSYHQLLDQLKLSQEQKSEIEALHISRKAELKTLKDNTSLSKTDKRAELEKIKEKTQNEISAILTVEQRQELTQLRETRKDLDKLMRQGSHQKASPEQREARQASNARISSALSKSERKTLAAVITEMKATQDPTESLQASPRGPKGNAKSKHAHRALHDMKENSPEDYTQLVKMSEKHAELLDAEFQQKADARGEAQGRRSEHRRAKVADSEKPQKASPEDRTAHRRIMQLLASQRTVDKKK